MESKYHDSVAINFKAIFTGRESCTSFLEIYNVISLTVSTVLKLCRRTGRIGTLASLCICMSVGEHIFRLDYNISQNKCMGIPVSLRKANCTIDELKRVSYIRNTSGNL